MNKKLIARLLLVGSGCCALNANAQTLTPFPTTTRNYAYVGKPGLNAAISTISLYISSNPAVPGGGFGSGTPVTFTNGTAQDLNGAGISSVDGFMYGIEYLYAGPNSASAYFYRVGANAVAQRIGIIPAPTSNEAGRTIQYSFVNTAAGTVDAAGDYWFSAYTLTDLAVPFLGSKADVFIGKVSGLNTLAAGTPILTPTYYHLDISDTAVQRGYANFMSSAAALVLNGFPYTNVNGGWQDMDINPNDGKFYTYLAFPSTPTPLFSPYPEPPLGSYLVRIDPVNTGAYWGKLVPVNTTANMIPNYEEDGAFFDPAGNFYTLFTNGQYGQVNTATGALGPLSTSILPLINGELRGDLATNTPITPLPVKLVSFRGALLQDAIVLQWSINDWHELSNVRVERSADGKSFTSLHEAQPKEMHEAYTDAAPLATGLYRLRMETLSGAVSYSPTIRLSRTGDALTTVHPNPMQNYVIVQSGTSSIAVSLTDLSGRLLLNNTYDNAGSSAMYISLPEMQPGNYLLSVRDSKTGASLLSRMMTKK